MEISSCIVEIIIAFFYFNGVLGRRRTIGNYFWLIAAVAVICNIARSYLYLSFAVNIGITIIMWTVIATVGFNGKLSRKIFFIVVNAIAVLVSEILTAMFLSTFLEIEYDDGFTQRYLGMILSTVLLFVFDIYFIYIAKRKYRQLPLKYNVLMILCPAFSVFLLLLLDTYIAQALNHHYLGCVIAVIGLVYINIMVFDFFDYYEKGLQAASMDIMLKANTENYRLLEENEKELHIMRHDILKYMAEIKEMISRDNKEEVQKYVEELNQIVGESTSLSRTGNLALDTVLNIESKKALSAGIQYDVKLNISEDILISSVDLSGILYNAIDNAIEACEKVSKKFILISITADAGKIKIIVENTSPDVTIENNTIKTSKQDFKKHGYGIASIKRKLEHYDGFMSLDYQNGVFVCRILMKNIACK